MFKVGIYNMEYDPEVPNIYKNWVKSEATMIIEHEKILKRTSKAVVLVNIIDEYDEDCEDDVRYEASKFGKVVDFSVHLDEGPFTVQIYLLFDDEVSSELFIKTMDGRFYSGKKISAYFYSENEFLANNLGNQEFFISRTIEKGKDSS